MKTVFFLDDNKEFLTLARLFAEHRCDCAVVSSESYAETVAQKENVLKSDIAILDINLGFDKPSGIEVYHWLRKNGYKKTIYFLTGHAMTSPLVKEAQNFGDATVLTKPFHPQSLKELIGSAA